MADAVGDLLEGDEPSEAGALGVVVDDCFSGKACVGSGSPATGGTALETTGGFTLVLEAMAWTLDGCAKVGWAGVIGGVFVETLDGKLSLGGAKVGCPDARGGASVGWPVVVAGVACAGLVSATIDCPVTD